MVAAAARHGVLAALPHALTASRVVSAPLIVWCIFNGRMGVAAVLVGAAMVTDYLDGPIIRRFGTPSVAGAYFDVWADFLVVVAAFGGLGLAGMVPLWPLLPICFSFALFLLTSRHTPGIYDPVGRYIGGLLMVAALLLLLVDDFLIQEVVYHTAAAACLVTILARLVYLATRPQRAGLPPTVL